MCTGAEVAVLAGTAAQQYGDQQTRRDQSHEAERAAALAAEVNRKAGARVTQEVDKLKTSNPEQDQTNTTNEYLAALRKAQLTGGGSDAPVGNVSDEFTADSGAVKASNVSGNRAAATNLAAIDAPYLQRAREAAGTSRATSDLGRIQSEAAGQDFLSKLRMSLIGGNPGLTAAGQFAQGWGNGAAQRAPKPAKLAGGRQLFDTTSSGVPA